MNNAGATTVDASGFFEFFQSRLRAWLTTLSYLNVRPANGFVDIAATSVSDFIVIATAAGGANIGCRLNTSPTAPGNLNAGLGCCIIRMDLRAGLMDVRLCYFLYEVFCMAVVGGAIEAAQGRSEWKEIAKWEEWVSQFDDSR